MCVCVCGGLVIIMNASVHTVLIVVNYPCHVELKLSARQFISDHKVLVKHTG